MAEKDTEPGNAGPVENDEVDTSGSDSPAGGKSAGRRGGFKNLLSGGKLKLLLAFVAAGMLSAVAVGLLIFGGGGEKQPPEAVATTQVGEPARPLISTSRAREIARFRSELRNENRSSRNIHLQKKMGEAELYRLAVRSELALLARMFDHYMATTVRFYELFRIMANKYVERPSQVRDLFENELLPDYKATERRRRMLRRRVEHDVALELYNRLDYIAYHDSIAVSSFQDFLDEGGADNFANTAGLVNESKFMIKEFRGLLVARLNEFEIEYDVSEIIWDRYYGKWPW